MKFGVVYVQSGIGYKYDRATIHDFIQAVEELGYDYLLTYDLVTKTAKLFPPVNDSEPFTLLSYAAALTTKLELATGILVLPSRQTMLVAKQAAELDLLSGRRVSGITGADGTVTLYSDRQRKPQGNWCFEVTDVVKVGYTYNASANVVTLQCE